MPDKTRIPALIHQTWKDADVPLKWRAWAESWRRHHPGWGYRLWTDADNRAFLAEHYPWFLPVYDGYPEAIMRVDVIRYFLLDHFGGVYADLDFECLCPVDEILAGRELVLGCEPEAHTRLLPARERGFDRIVGHAFIASRPGHPFWAHAHRELIRAHKSSSAPDATGAFFLTRAIDRAPESGSITVLGSQSLYPAVSPYATRLFGQQDVDLDQAYAVHHWSGSWAHDASWTPRTSAGRRVRFWGSQDLQPLADGAFDVDAQRRRWASGAPAPMVSCLMVTKDRLSMAKRAIRCFLAQTYPNVELVVVPDGAGDALEAHIRGLDDPRIRFHQLPSDGRPLGALRNVAVDQAGGPYVCTWDDDDLYDPERVEVQMAAILALGAGACFLARERLWWPARRKLAVSNTRVWENSMVCAKDKLPRYPALRRGSDTPVAEQLLRTCRVVSVDGPDLYTHVYHGNNTWDEAHFAQFFDGATEMWVSRGAYADQVLAMATRLPIDPGDLIHAESLPGTAEPAEPSPGADGPAPPPLSGRPRAAQSRPCREATPRENAAVGGEGPSPH